MCGLPPKAGGCHDSGSICASTGAGSPAGGTVTQPLTLMKPVARIWSSWRPGESGAIRLHQRHIAIRMDIHLKRRSVQIVPEIAGDFADQLRRVDGLEIVLDSSGLHATEVQQPFDKPPQALALTRDDAVELTPVFVVRHPSGGKLFGQETH